MVTNIAVVTTSGKAYYRLVSELRRRRVPFLSLSPGKHIPLSVKAAITTEAEKGAVHCSGVLVYDESTDPSGVVERALQLVRGKNWYREVTVGVDPGKTFGLAVLVDGVVLEAETSLDEKEAAQRIVQVLGRLEGGRKVVKIGSGAEAYQSKLMQVLRGKLPLDVDLEVVEENKTTKNAKRFGREGSKDALSAVEISMRSGRRIVRRGDVE